MNTVAEAMTASATARAKDGLLMLGTLRYDVLSKLESLSRSIPARRATVSADALSSLELHCKVEEELLLPALSGQQRSAARIVDAGALDVDLGRLRVLAKRVRYAAGADVDVSAAALAGAAMLHFDALERALEAAPAGLDRHALAQAAAALLRRCCAEPKHSAQIENEESDPVGLKPRY